MAKGQSKQLAVGAISAFSTCVPGQHVVRRGECLWSIAADRLKSPLRWSEIAQLNRLAQPYRIFVGQTLKLPVETTSSSATRLVKAGQGPLMKPTLGLIKVDRNALKPAFELLTPKFSVDLVKLELAPVPLGPTTTAKLKLEGKIEISDTRIKNTTTYAKDSITVKLQNEAQDAVLRLFGSLKLRETTGGLVLDFGLDSESKINKGTTLGSRVGLPRPDLITGGWISDFSVSTTSIFGRIGFHEFKGKWSWTCEVHQKDNKNGDGLVPFRNPVRAPDSQWSPVVQVLVAAGLLTLKMAETAAQMATGCFLITLDAGMSGAGDPYGRIIL